MNLYTSLASRIGSSEAQALAARVAAWHDAMVAHERRLKSNGAADICHDECPHVAAGMLWAEALTLLGSEADELTFLRSRASGGANGSGSGHGS